MACLRHTIPSAFSPDVEQQARPTEKRETSGDQPIAVVQTIEHGSRNHLARTASFPAPLNILGRHGNPLDPLCGIARGYKSPGIAVALGSVVVR